MFYVYHKIRGDRLSGPEYRLLGWCEGRVAADAAAVAYNQQNGYTQRGLHCAVVRVRPVKM